MFLFRLFLLFTTLKFAIITRTQGAGRPPVSTPRWFASAKGQGTGKAPAHRCFWDRGPAQPHSPTALTQRTWAEPRAWAPGGREEKHKMSLQVTSVSVPVHPGSVGEEKVGRNLKMNNHGTCYSLPAPHRRCPDPHRILQPAGINMQRHLAAHGPTFSPMNGGQGRGENNAFPGSPDVSATWWAWAGKGF